MAITGYRNAGDFFAVLRSPPRAIDALDTLYEPNAVSSQFLGSASIVFLFSSFLSLLPVLFSSLLFFSFLFFSFLVSRTFLILSFLFRLLVLFSSFSN